MPTHREIYKGYLISCNAVPLDVGGFRAQVAVINVEGDKTRAQRFIDLPDTYSSETGAKEDGVAAGRDWVEANGNKPDSGFHIRRSRPL